MAVRLRVLVKVVMVLVIILAVWHLASNFGREQRRNRRRDSKSFDKIEEANDGDRIGQDGAERGPRRLGEGSEPSKGMDEEQDHTPPQIGEEMGDNRPQFNVEKGDNMPQINEEKGETSPQTGEEKGDNTPLILLWNNYQGDKSALYNKIFHR